MTLCKLGHGYVGMLLLTRNEGNGLLKRSKKKKKGTRRYEGVITMIRAWAFRFMCQGDHLFTNLVP